ncbi:MAG: hypothetical protein KA072_10130 [Thermoanaerobaculaceae bacterium]|nr:hypothetical protein [Thermoanaerobaculaceae bacterium]MDI9622802.1 hypothetical protein [Acidobacteriota bacterium]NLH11831.1 hypothetical protein [Holophagae bacterium]HPW55315.1 hypothetical protein [Thermoanaerobaculaceae bacterium]
MVMSRAELDEKAHTLVNAFLAATYEEDPGLAKSLAMLGEEGKLELAGVLGRFENRGLAPAQQRLMARRFLGRLRKPTAQGLALTNRVLDFLDRQGSSRLDDRAIAIGLELLEAFARVESDNDTLSERELELLGKAVRLYDRDDNRVLDDQELERLRAALKDGTLLHTLG